MPSKNIVKEFVPEAYYHIYNRGVAKQKIFLDDQDYKTFLSYLKLYLTFPNLQGPTLKVSPSRQLKNYFDQIKLLAYCLMPNHFHLFVWQKDANEITNFMRSLITKYAIYFNKKYKRTGGLFGGNFKSNLVNTDEYLKYMFSYIHLNPIKTIEPGWKKDGIKNIQRSVDFLKKYKWSSYQDYCEVNRIEGKILSRESFPGYFTDVEILKKEIFEWLLFSPTLDIGEIKEK